VCSSDLGLAYRGGVKEAAFSGALKLVELLLAAGALPKIHDPMFSDSEISSMGFSPFRFGEKCDALILQTNHGEYLNIRPEDFPGAAFFVDGRNFSPQSFRASIKTHVIGIGKDSRVDSV
jgi:UDP-N-acetyl-D-mannosaminuronate dehydrogenase